jgi:hypothetical protein
VRVARDKAASESGQMSLPGAQRLEYTHKNLLLKKAFGWQTFRGRRADDAHFARGVFLFCA